MKRIYTIRQLAIAAIFAICAPSGVLAQETDLKTLQTRQDSQGWEAVGRLDIRGKGFCTAALIRDRLILTAAHCLYDVDGSVIAADRFSFLAGLRDGQAQASRRVTRAVAHPDYDHGRNAASTSEVALDIAVLELDRPIRNSRILPYQIAQRPITGDEVGVVSYGRGRADAASLQQICNVLGRQTGVIVMTCDVEYGSSGSPVFVMDDGQTRIASVVSAMAQVNGQKVSLGTSLEGPLNALLSHFATLGPARPGGTQRLINSQDRNDTGAKFVRP